MSGYLPKLFSFCYYITHTYVDINCSRNIVIASRIVAWMVILFMLL